MELARRVREARRSGDLEGARRLALVAETCADAHVAAYREAIRFYAQDVERTWT